MRASQNCLLKILSQLGLKLQGVDYLKHDNLNPFLEFVCCYNTNSEDAPLLKIAMTSDRVFKEISIPEGFFDVWLVCSPWLLRVTHTLQICV